MLNHDFGDLTGVTLQGGQLWISGSGNLLEFTQLASMNPIVLQGGAGRLTGTLEVQAGEHDVIYMGNAMCADWDLSGLVRMGGDALRVMCP